MSAQTLPTSGDGAGSAPPAALFTPAPTTLFIVVDVQRDFCPGGALPVPGGDEVIPVINRSLPLLQPLGLHPGLAPADHISFAEHPQFRDGSWPPHAVQGTPGAAWCDGLEMPMNAILVSKGDDPDYEAYSGFQVKRLDLAEFLRLRKVERVFVGRAGDRLLREADGARRPGGRVHRLSHRGRGPGRSARHDRGRLRRAGGGRRHPHRFRPGAPWRLRRAAATAGKEAAIIRGRRAERRRRGRRLAALGRTRGPGASHRLLPADHDGRLLEDRPPRSERLLRLHVPRPASAQRLRHHRRAGATARPGREPALHRPGPGVPLQAGRLRRWLPGLSQVLPASAAPSTRSPRAPWSSRTSPCCRSKAR